MKKILFLFFVCVLSGIGFFPSVASAATVYWYNDGVDSNWSTLEGNWWLDSDHTVPAVELPSSSDVVVSLGATGPVVDSGSWVQPEGIDVSANDIEFAVDLDISMSDPTFTVTGTVMISAPLLAYMGQIIGDVSVYNGSYIQFQSDVFGNVYLHDDSLLNGSATVSGTVILYDNASSYGEVTDLVVSSTAYGSLPQAGVWVIDNTYLVGAVNGTIYGPGLVPVTQIVFTGSSVNRMSFTADAVFNDTSSNDTSPNGGSIYGDVTVSTTYYGSLPQGGVFTFDTTSWVEWRGSISGTIFGSDGLPITEYRFLKHNANYFSSTLTGDAYFGCGAEHHGSFTGTVTIETDCTRYFYSTSSSDWMDVGNWYEDNGATIPSDSVPSEGFETIVVAGSVAPEVDIDLWITPDSVDASETGISFTSITTNAVDGVVTGDASFYGDLQVYATVYGDAFFYDSTVNYGVIDGDATFICGANNYGTVNGTLTTDSCERYFYSASSTDWHEPNNWFFDVDHALPTGSVPDSAFYAVYVVPTSVAPLVNLDVWDSVYYIFATSTGISFTSGVGTLLSGLTVYGDTSFYGLSILASSIDGNAFFYDGSTMSGGVTGDVYIDCGANVGGGGYGGTLTYGECATYFYSTSSTDWTDVNNWYADELHTEPTGAVPTESDVAYVVSGSVVPLIDLNTWSRPLSINAGDVGIVVTSSYSVWFYPNVTGTVSFYGSGILVGADVVISGDVSFYNNVRYFGTVSGSAYFYDTSTLDGTITGDATFACGATNDGTVLGEVTAESCAIYFYSTSSTDWDDLDNWWLDTDHTVPATELPSESSEVYIVSGSVEPIVLVDVGVSEGWWESPTLINTNGGEISFINFLDETGVSIYIDTIIGNVTVSGTVDVYDIAITGDVTLRSYARLVIGYGEASVSGTVFAYDRSGIYDSPVTGDVFLYDDAYLDSPVSGDVYVDCGAEIQEDVVVGGTITYETECLSGEILEPTGITKTGATLRAIIHNTGGSPIVYRGFVYVAVADMSDEDAVEFLLESGEWGAGEFTRTITGLICGTEYIAVSYAQNEDNSSIYGEDSGVIFFETLSCSAPDPESPEQSSSGGGAKRILSKPSFLSPTTQTWTKTGVVQINNNALQTKTRRVRINIPKSTATKMAISNSLDFSKSSFRPFATSTQWTLAPGAGTKTVYVKILSADGVSIILSDIIEYVPRTTRTTSSIVSNSTAPQVSVVPQKTSSSFVFQSFLTFGSRGLEVLELQKKLQSLGFFPSTITPNGVFGPATQAAVVAFQRANGIDPFGYVGPATRAVLNK